MSKPTLYRALYRASEGELTATPEDAIEPGRYDSQHKHRGQSETQIPTASDHVYGEVMTPSEMGRKGGKVYAEKLKSGEVPHTETTNSRPGTYSLYDAAGNYAGWYRHFKDAKFAASQIGGKTVKIAALPKPVFEPKNLIKMPDGSFAPMTNANIKIATDYVHAENIKNPWWRPKEVK
jgi:hypothetical protein